MQKLILILAVTAIGLGLAFWIATTVAQSVSASLNASGEMIANAAAGRP